MRLIINSIALPANVHKKILPVFRLIIAVSLVSYMAWILVQAEIWDMKLWKSSMKLTLASVVQLFIAIVLMPLNWGLETLKWKLLASKVENISWKRTLHGVFYGISLGMITPKRTGEFAGRIYTLAPENRLSGLLLNTAGSLSQLFITLMLGCAAMFTQMNIVSFPLKLSPGNTSIPLWLLVAGITIALLIITLLFLAAAMPRRPDHQNVESKFARLLKIFTLLSVRDVASLLLLSLMRYMVFVAQFYLLLKVFGLHHISFFIATQLIAITYLVMTLVPLSAIWELGVRGTVAIFVFGMYTSKAGIAGMEVAVLTATTLLWFINLGIPALAGGLLGLNHELKQSNTAYDD